MNKKKKEIALKYARGLHRFRDLPGKKNQEKEKEKEKEKETYAERCKRSSSLRDLPEVTFTPTRQKKTRKEKRNLLREMHVFLFACETCQGHLPPAGGVWGRTAGIDAGKMQKGSKKTVQHSRRKMQVFFLASETCQGLFCSDFDPCVFVCVCVCVCTRTHTHMCMQAITRPPTQTHTHTHVQTSNACAGFRVQVLRFRL